MNPRGPVGARHRARKRFAQHFLEAQWADRVVEAIAPREGEQIVEIGPGLGALTLRLASRGAVVRAVEIDRDLAGALGDRLPAGVTVVCGDFLALDAPDILGAAGRVRIVGNLPYNLSSPILARVHELARTTQRISDATLMLQREVAERVLAQPGGGDYGPLAILLGLDADRSRLLNLPPGAFRPAPKVHSTVIQLRFRPRPVAVEDYAAFDRLVRTLFQRRRKTVANALSPLTGNRPAAAAAVLQSAAIDPACRPETLGLEDLARLAARLAAAHAQSVL